MSLRHAILALLNHKEATGYELANKFDGSIGLFWKATHQQIYQELKSLSERGLVTFKRVDQKERPDKKIYRLNPPGKKELEQWLKTPTDISPIKEGILIKVFAGHLVKDEELRADLLRYRAQYEDSLAKYREIEKLFDKPRLTHSQKLRYLTLRRGIRYAREWIEWCDEALEVLK